MGQTLYCVDDLVGRSAAHVVGACYLLGFVYHHIEGSIDVCLFDILCYLEGVVEADMPTLHYHGLHLPFPVFVSAKGSGRGSRAGQKGSGRGSNGDQKGSRRESGGGQKGSRRGLRGGKKGSMGASRGG